MHAPARPLRTSRRCLTGRVALAHGSPVSFESSLERDWLLIQDFDRSVVEVREQPFTITYTDAGRSRRYTPDVLVIKAMLKRAKAIHSHEVFEVKPLDDLREHWHDLRARFLAANHYCRERGWKFSIVTEREIRTPLLANARFLRPYRNIADNVHYRTQLMNTLGALERTTPQALLQAAFWDTTSRLEALPTLWQMVALDAVRAPIRSERLTMATRIESVG